MLRCGRVTSGAIHSTEGWESETHMAGHIEVRMKREVEWRDCFGLPGSNAVVMVRATSREMYVVAAMKITAPT
jgi:hypothetical protein